MINKSSIISALYESQCVTPLKIKSPEKTALEIPKIGRCVYGITDNEVLSIAANNNLISVITKKYPEIIRRMFDNDTFAGILGSICTTEELGDIMGSFISAVEKDLAKTGHVLAVVDDG